MDELVERDFEAFFQVPFEVYGQETPYVSPMKADLRRYLSGRHNPLFASNEDFTFFCVKRDGKAVGRIVVHSHAASNQRFGTGRASFGFFDCAQDLGVSKQLLNAAASWASAKGFDELAGNFNLTAMQQCGVQTGGFGQTAFTDMIVNPSYIPDLLEANGFERVFPMTTFEVDLTAARQPVSAHAPPIGESFTPIRRRDFKQRMEEARRLLNDGFDQNPMFVPLSEEEFRFQAGEMMAIIDPRLSSILTKDGIPVGVVICIPDLTGFFRATRSRLNVCTPWHFLKYRFNRKRAVIVFYSVAQRFQGRGVMGRMLARTVKTLRDSGYERLGITWIADINQPSLRQMEKLGATPLHRLHLFKKALQ